jgi:hypothetical protein
MCQGGTVRREVSGEHGAAEDIGSFDRQVVGSGEGLSSEGVGSPLAVGTAVDQRGHDHR